MDYSILSIHAALAYFALALTMISPWIKRSPWVWGSFLIFAFILGYFAHIITPIALAPIGALFILHSLLKGEIKGFIRFILVVITAGISLGLLFHMFPGFNNVNLFQNQLISPNGIPVSLYLNFDKPFIGVFVLVLGFPLITNFSTFFRLLKAIVPLTLCGIFIMIALALFSGLIEWDPKFPSIFWVFAIENLLYVCISEEAFFRGFIQNEFFRWFGGKGYLANCGCVLITAFLFAALHYPWVSSIPFLGLVFVAGIIYGSIFQFTKSLEASIFCHWIFNLTHLLLFTYPALKSAI